MNAQVSEAAIEHVDATVGLVSPSSLRSALYVYGRRPCTAAWAGRFPDERRVRDALQPSLDRLVERGWAVGRLSPDNDRWHLYLHADRVRGRDRFPVKLYINVGGDDLLASFPSLAMLVDDAGAPALKVASDPPGLLRPDKCVLYLPSLDAAVELGERIGNLLGQADVQPLPFTGALDSRGLVSVGFDPPSTIASTFGESSWRGFVCAAIAAALLDAAGRRLTPSQRLKDVLRNVASLGIDARRWVPRVLL